MSESGYFIQSFQYLECENKTSLNYTVLIIDASIKDKIYISSKVFLKYKAQFYCNIGHKRRQSNAKITGAVYSEWRMPNENFGAIFLVT